MKSATSWQTPKAIMLMLTVVWVTAQVTPPLRCEESAYLFDGEAFMDLGDGDWYRLQNQTMEFWIRPSIANRKFSGIIGAIYDSGEDESGVGFQAGNHGHVEFYVTPAFLDSAKARGPTPTGVWTHVAGVVIGGSVSKLFINGTLYDSRPLTGLPFYGLPVRFWVARFRDNNEDTRFQGSMDEIRMWNYARTDEQIAEYYSKSVLRSPSMDTTGLLLSLNGDTNCQSETRDQSGNARPMESTNVRLIPASDLWKDDVPACAEMQTFYDDEIANFSGTCADLTKPGQGYFSSGPVPFTSPTYCDVQDTFDLTLLTSIVAPVGWSTSDLNTCELDRSFGQMSWLSGFPGFFPNPLRTPQQLSADRHLDVASVDWHHLLKGSQQNQLVIDLELDGRRTRLVLIFEYSGHVQSVSPSPPLVHTSFWSVLLTEVPIDELGLVSSGAIKPVAIKRVLLPLARPRLEHTDGTACQTAVCCRGQPTATGDTIPCGVDEWEFCCRRTSNGGEQTEGVDPKSSWLLFGSMALMDAAANVMLWVPLADPAHATDLMYLTNSPSVVGATGLPARVLVWARPVSTFQLVTPDPIQIAIPTGLSGQIATLDYIFLQQSPANPKVFPAVLDGQPLVFTVMVDGEEDSDTVYEVALPSGGGLGVRFEIDLRWCTQGLFSSSQALSREATTIVQLQGSVPGTVITTPEFESLPSSGFYDNNRCMRMSAVSGLYTLPSLVFASVVVALVPEDIVDDATADRRSRRAIEPSNFVLQPASFVRVRYEAKDGSPLTTTFNPPLLTKFDDTQPPVFEFCPPPVVSEELLPGENEVYVVWRVPVALESGTFVESRNPLVVDTFQVQDSVSVETLPQSRCEDDNPCLGASFSLAGSPYTVIHTAADAVGNEATCKFQVRAIPASLVYEVSATPVGVADIATSDPVSTGFGDSTVESYLIGTSAGGQRATSTLPNLDRFANATTDLFLTVPAEDTYAFQLDTGTFVGHLDFNLEWEVPNGTALPTAGSNDSSIPDNVDYENCNALEFRTTDQEFAVTSRFAVTTADMTLDLYFQLLNPVPGGEHSLVRTSTGDGLGFLRMQLVDAGIETELVVRSSNSGPTVFNARRTHAADLEVGRWYFLSVVFKNYNDPAIVSINAFLDGHALTQTLIGERGTERGPAEVTFDRLEIGLAPSLSTGVAYRVAEFRLWESARNGEYNCPAPDAPGLVLHYIFTGCGAAIRDLSTRPRHATTTALWVVAPLPKAQLQCAAQQSTSSNRLEMTVTLDNRTPGGDNSSFALSLDKGTTAVTRRALQFVGVTAQLPAGHTWTHITFVLSDLQRSFLHLFAGRTLVPTENSFVKASFLQSSQLQSTPFQVVDNQAPTIDDCVADLTTSTDAGSPVSAVAWSDGVAVDNAIAPAALNWTYSPPAGTTFPIGTTAVNATVADQAGNTAQCTFAITVVDNEPPTITCPENAVLSASGDDGKSSEVFFENGNTRIVVSDNSGNVSLATSVPSGTKFEQGTTVVDATATDLAGLLATCSFSVTVPSSNSGDDNIGLAIGLALGLALLLFLLLLFCLCRRTEKQPHDFSKEVDFVTKNLINLSERDRKVPREIKRSMLQLVETIGEGAFGVVSSALMQETDKAIPPYQVAVKQVLSDKREDALREAAILAQFDHPNVIALSGVVTTEDPILLILTYCQEGSLHQFLTRRTGFDALTLTSRLNLALDISNGLAYLHSLKFVHRDLAARNVLVGTDYRAMISDFGMARELAHDTSVYQADYVYTRLPVRWTAPEAFTHNVFCAKSDVWSFGVLLYEIWTNCEHEPFSGWSGPEVVDKVRQGYRLPCPPECPDRIYETLIVKCWMPSPDDRPTAARVRDYFKHCVVDAKLAEHWRPRLQTKREAFQSNSVDQLVRLPDGTSIRQSVSVDQRGPINDAYIAAGLGAGASPQRNGSGSPARQPHQGPTAGVYISADGRDLHGQYINPGYHPDTRSPRSVNYPRLNTGYSPPQTNVELIDADHSLQSTRDESAV